MHIRARSPRLRRIGLTLSTALLASLSLGAQAYVKPVKEVNGQYAFVDNGASFRFVGANITALPWYSDAEIDQELDYARSLGSRVVRVWAVDSSMNADEMARRLTNVLTRAEARGMYVLIALTHNYYQPNWVWNARTGANTVHGVPDDTRPNGFTSNPRGFYSRKYVEPGGYTHWLLDDPWIDWGHGAYYKPFVGELVSRLRDHRAVFGWDIANEVATSTPGDVTLTNHLADFYVEMAAFIKSKDSNHMVGTGLISTQWAGFNQTQRDRIHHSGDIDFVTVHEYHPNSNPGSYEQDVVLGNTRWKKPVIIEEYGADHVNGLDARNVAFRYYAKRFRAADAGRRVAGILYFGVSKFDWYAANTWYTQPHVADPAKRMKNWYPSLSQIWERRLNEFTAQCGRLVQGDLLASGNDLKSCNGRHKLSMQDDGNLVLYKTNGAGGWTVRWASNTNGRGPSDFVVYRDTLLTTSINGWQWTRKCTGNISVFAVQDDGNMVAYGPNGQVLCNFDTWSP